MAVRALDFEHAHPATDASQVGVDDRLAERITRVEVLAVQEQAGRHNEQGAVSRRLELRARIHYQMLRHLVRTAQVAVQDEPALAAKFTLPRTGMPHRYFLTAAREMLERATEFKEVLIAHGLGATLLDELSQALAEFDAATGTVHAGKSLHVGARADLSAAVNDCVQLVGLLDGLNQRRYGSDPELLAAWQSARTVVGGSPRRKGTKESGGEPGTASADGAGPQVPVM